MGRAGHGEHRQRTTGPDLAPTDTFTVFLAASSEFQKVGKGQGWLDNLRIIRHGFVTLQRKWMAS